MKRHLSASHIWGMPIVLALLSAMGLASALFGDDIWDALSWVTLGAPVAVIVWYVAMGGKPAKGTLR